MSRKSFATFIGLVVILATIMTGCVAAPAAAPAPTAAAAAPAAKEAAAPAAPGQCTLPDEIKIGVNETMTGWGAPYGDMTWKGIQLANKKKPTILGKPVKLVLVDNKSDKSEAALAAQRLVDVEKVVAVIGANSSSISMAQNEVLDKAKVVSIATAATNPLVTTGKPYAFRAAFIDPFQGAVAAKYAIEKLGAKKAVLLVDITLDYPVGLANYFRQEFIKETGDDHSILGYQSFQTGDRDFNAQLTAIKNLKPDIVFAPNEYAEEGALLQQAKQLGLTPDIKFLAGDSADVPELVQIAKDAAEGFQYTAQFHPDAFKHPEGAEFSENFKKAYNQDGETFSVTGYDGYLILADAIERAGCTDSESIRKAMVATKDFVGARGKFNFDKDHNGVLAAPVIGIKDGKKTLMSVVEP
jgi:branched-chain amino acid transport system substrate-binding protein